MYSNKNNLLTNVEFCLYCVYILFISRMIYICDFTIYFYIYLFLIYTTSTYLTILLTTVPDLLYSFSFYLGPIVQGFTCFQLGKLSRLILDNYKGYEELKSYVLTESPNEERVVLDINEKL